MQRFTYLLHKNAKPERSANSLPDNVTRYQCPYGGAQSASRRLNRTHLSKNHGITPPAVTGESSTANCTQVRPLGLPTCVLCHKSFSHWKARETHEIKGHCINIDCQQPDTPAGAHMQDKPTPLILRQELISKMRTDGWQSFLSDNTFALKRSITARFASNEWLQLQVYRNTCLGIARNGSNTCPQR